MLVASPIVPTESKHLIGVGVKHCDNHREVEDIDFVSSQDQPKVISCIANNVDFSLIVAPFCLESHHGIPIGW